MRPPRSPLPFTCLQCRLRLLPQLPRSSFHSSARLRADLPPPPPPTSAPKPSINIKNIRYNANLYKQSCLDKNYKTQSEYPDRIKSLFEEWHVHQSSATALRQRNNLLNRQLAKPSAVKEDDSPEVKALKEMSKEELINEARMLKEKIGEATEKENAIMAEVESMALSIPNLTSNETPRDGLPKVVGYINHNPDLAPYDSERVWRSHDYVGSVLNLLDFTGSATTSGWGWYSLMNEGAMLEQALVQYALRVARKRGWEMVTPPSMVYSHIAAACGFQPRDQNGEHQIYNIQQNPADVGRKPELCLAGTAEIPLAGMQANRTLNEAKLPMKQVGVSRCYRAEAGARGVDTKGLYRVHEFTKVEMFAWTLPSDKASMEIFDEMLSIQKEILTGLDLHCRIIEMPSTDLGASATRKRDIEAFFPSRKAKDEGWGEVTSVSTCTDYQTRRLATTVNLKSEGGKTAFPYTVNGTALAVPRVLAAILEHGWDEAKKEVRIPEVLWPWMDFKRHIKLKGGRETSG